MFLIARKSGNAGRRSVVNHRAIPVNTCFTARETKSIGPVGAFGPRAIRCSVPARFSQPLLRQMATKSKGFVERSAHEALLVVAVMVMSAFGSVTDARAQAPSHLVPAVSGERTGSGVVQDRSSSPAVAGINKFSIWRKATLGIFQSAAALREALDAAHVRIGDAANEILGRPGFSFGRRKIELDLVVVSVADLGFGGRGASLADVHARAAQLGLELCPAELAPNLRLQYLNQPIGESLQIAMKPEATYHGEPIALALTNGGEGLLLIGGDAHPDQIQSAPLRFVFVRPRGAVVSARRDVDISVRDR
jgi:hypothetical protein